MIIQSFNFLPKRIVGQFRQWIFISMRAPKQLLFLSIFWRIKKQKSNPLILSLRNISDLCFSPFFYIISSFILDFILLISFNKLFTGLKTWEYNSSTSPARGGLQVGLQCCCCASVQCLKVFINLPSLRTPLSHTGRKGKWQRTENWMPYAVVLWGLCEVTREMRFSGQDRGQKKQS